jgi:putative addiction module CopG family antidote
MGQMNDQLAGYVRKKVKSGRYNNAGEVVPEALRRMEDEEERALRLAKPTAEDLLAELTAEQVDTSRRHVGAGIEDIEAGRFAEYEGPAGLRKLAHQVKAKGRRLLERKSSGK